MKPKHYANLKVDTFELWEKNRSPQDRIAAADFNISKYVMRDKGCNYEDYNKIIDYCEYAKRALLDLSAEADAMAEYFEEENKYGNIK